MYALLASLERGRRCHLWRPPATMWGLKHVRWVARFLLRRVFFCTTGGSAKLYGGRLWTTALGGRRPAGYVRGGRVGASSPRACPPGSCDGEKGACRSAALTDNDDGPAAAAGCFAGGGGSPAFVYDRGSCRCPFAGGEWGGVGVAAEAEDSSVTAGLGSGADETPAPFH